MTSMNGGAVREAVAESSAVLRGRIASDWGTRIPEMEWTVGEAVAHIAEGLVWYATDLWAGAEELTTMTLSMRTDAAPADLVRSVEAFGAVTAAAIDAAAPDRIGWHPMGRPDRSGFAAMACDEILIHTSDATRGLGGDFEPGESLCRAVVTRLFPGAPEGHGAWETLLWANGRIALPGHPRQTGWVWHCAPLQG